MNTTTQAVNYKIREVAPCQKELTIDVPQDQVDLEFEEVYRKFKKQAQVPGFRVGNAPQNLLEQHYGDKARQEVTQKLISRTLNEILTQEKNLSLVGDPVVTEIKLEPHQEAHFTAKIEIMPEISLGRYKGLALNRPKLAVDDKQMTDVLTRLQESQGQLTPLLELRATQPGDFLLADLTEKKGDAQSVRRPDVMVHLDLDKDLEGILKNLVGMNPGDKRQVDLKDGTQMTVELKGIKIKVLPMLDDAFAKSLGDFESLEALKKNVGEGLGKEMEMSSRRVLEGQACERLLADWNFDVPPSMMASQARHVLKDRAMALMNQGIPPEKIDEQAQVLSDQAKVEALKQVKLFFILRRIAQAEKITAAPEEIQEHVQRLAQSAGVDPTQMRKDLEQKDLLGQLAWNLVRAKVMDRIIQEAQIKEENQKA